MVTAGEGMEMRVLTAVIIGGASLAGGEGTILGAFLGSVLMALVTNAVNILGVNVYWQTFIVGLTLLVAVLTDSFGKKQRTSRLKKLAGNV
jgi:ribose transport system permease protein